MSRASASCAIRGIVSDAGPAFRGNHALSERTRPSRRIGIELSGDARPVDRVRMDAEVAYSRARFRNSSPTGIYIPGAVEGVVSAGIDYEPSPRAFAELRLRYFGARPLIEDNSVRSPPSTILNTQLGLYVTDHWAVKLQAFSLLASAVSDVAYSYP